MADDVLAPSHFRTALNPLLGERVTEVRRACFTVVSSHRALRASLRDEMRQLRVQRALLSERPNGQPRNGHPPRGFQTLDLKSRYGLTDRELEVAALLADGRGNAAIAVALSISPHTARHHTQHVLGKLGVHSRAEAGARLRV